MTPDHSIAALGDGTARQARWHGLFLAGVAVCAGMLVLVHALLAAEGRIPQHDSLSYCVMQSVFHFNEAAMRGGVPQWNPYVMCGMPAAWHSMVSLNMMAAAMADKFRHIGLTAPLAKVFIVLYAGFGFDAWWQLLRARDSGVPLPWPARAAIALPACTLACMLTVVIAGALSVHHWHDFGAHAPMHAKLFHTAATKWAAEHRVITLLYGLMAASAIAVCWPRRAVAAGCLLLAVHLFDVGTYKIEQETIDVPRAPATVHALFDVWDYAYAPQPTRCPTTPARRGHCWARPAPAPVSLSMQTPTAPLLCRPFVNAPRSTTTRTTGRPTPRSM